MSKAVLSSLLVVAAAAVLAGGASASARSSSTATSFCGVSKTVAKSLVSLASGLSASSSSADHIAVLKAQFQLVKRSEGSLRSNAPRKLKRPLGIVLGFVDYAYAKLNGVKWSLATLMTQPNTMAGLEAASNRASTSFAALKGYYRGTCHFGV